MKQHRYRTELEWTGNDGSGTCTYQSYRRSFTVSCSGKEAIEGSSDPAFRGEASRYNPEELLVASLSSCHMLWYLHLCSVHGVSVEAYRDEAEGTMEESRDGSGAFVGVELRPRVTISAGSDRNKALELHDDAHGFCFIARSVNFPVKVAAEIV